MERRNNTDIESIIRLIETKIPKSWDQVDNRLLLLRYIRKCVEIKYWLSKCHPDKKNFKILDFGCGNGQTTIILKELGFEVTGLELHSHEYWNNIDAHFVTYDGNNLPFSSSEFDAVAFFGVLEHIGTPYPRQMNKFDECQLARKECLIGLINILREGGLLFVYDFPNKYSPIEIVNELLNIPSHHDKTDKQSLSQVKNIVKNSGYDIIKAGRMGTLPAYFGLVSSFIKYKIINRHYKIIGIVDRFVDKILGNLLGQSNFIIAQKPSFI